MGTRNPGPVEAAGSGTGAEELLKRGRAHSQRGTALGRLEGVQTHSGRSKPLGQHLSVGRRADEQVKVVAGKKPGLLLHAGRAGVELFMLGEAHSEGRTCVARRSETAASRLARRSKQAA